MSYNLSELPESARKDIELERQASLSIHNLKRGKLTRAQINREMSLMPESERETFRRYLNIYKDGK